jgi:transketolase
MQQSEPQAKSPGQRDLLLRKHALATRRTFLRMHFEAQSGHIGTGLSAIDILTYLYQHWFKPHDRFILSKGHGASALYATLYHAGLLSESDFKTYYKDNTMLPAHPAPLAHPNIVLATGSLGHGLPVATGMAYAMQKLRAQHERRIVCLVSDGECNEGSVWEAAAFAAHHRLRALTVVVDSNGLQGFGRTQDVIDMRSMADKWQAFGFHVQEIDGHDFAALDAAFSAPQQRPRCIVAQTVKGKGVSFMEHELAWHYLPLKEDQLRTAEAQLQQLEEELADAC